MRSVFSGLIRLAIKNALREAFRYGVIWANREKSLDEPSDSTERQAFSAWYSQCDPMMEIRNAERDTRNARLRSFVADIKGDSQCSS